MKRWPMAKGSLAEVRKPCVRRNCRACLSGRKHPAFTFGFREKGRQRCPKCGGTVWPRLPGVLPKCLYGNQLLSHVVLEHYLRGTIVRIADSPFLGDFLRLGNRPVMDFTLAADNLSIFCHNLVLLARPPGK